ncbi:MAG: hypothetical protein Q7U24_14225 [Sulfurimicrobium sp.]|nr:hypothetical protein [Sulfurimicrobium sp.]
MEKQVKVDAAIYREPGMAALPALLSPPVSGMVREVLIQKI